MCNLLDLVMAITLLTAAADSPIAEDMNTQSVRAKLQQVAVYWELLDSREVRYVFARSEDFESDVNLLRRRYAELKDAPPAHDCQRFPERSIVNDFLAFNRAYRQHIDAQMPINPSRVWLYRTVLQETDHLYQIWDTVRDARCEYYYVTVRRQALKRLREALGNEKYYCGELPPHVPLWRFQSID